MEVYESKTEDNKQKATAEREREEWNKQWEQLQEERRLEKEVEERKEKERELQEREQHERELQERQRKEQELQERQRKEQEIQERQWKEKQQEERNRMEENKVKESTAQQEASKAGAIEQSVRSKLLAEKEAALARQRKDLELDNARAAALNEAIAKKHAHENNAHLQTPGHGSSKWQKYRDQLRAKNPTSGDFLVKGNTYDKSGNAILDPAQRYEYLQRISADEVLNMGEEERLQHQAQKLKAAFDLTGKKGTIYKYMS